jgi:hypothetical protein
MPRLWKSTTVCSTLSIVAVLLASSSAFAAIVPLGGGWQAQVPDDNTVSFVVDATSPDYLLIEVSKDFIYPPGPGGVFPAQPIDFLQIDTDENTVPRIVILDESISNQTGVEWTDFHWSLLDGGEVWFDLALSSGWSTDPFMEREWLDLHGYADPNKVTDLSVWGGVVPNNSGFFPGTGSGNGELVIDVDLTSDDPVSFLFKQFPTPEPSSLALILGVGVALLGRRRTS